MASGAYDKKVAKEKVQAVLNLESAFVRKFFISYTFKQGRFFLRNLQGPKGCYSQSILSAVWKQDGLHGKGLQCWMKAYQKYREMLVL